MTTTTTRRTWHGATPAQRARWASRIARYERDLRDEDPYGDPVPDVDPTDGPALYCAYYLAAGMDDDELFVLVGVESGAEGPTSDKPGLLRAHDCAVSRREECVVMPWSLRRSKILREAMTRLERSEP